jgi:uncharacterized protein YciI
MRSLLIILGLVFSFQSLAQDYNHVFVFLNSKPDKEKISAEDEAALQKAHRKNIDRLVEEGKMIVAGPFEGGGGIFILTTGEISQAKAWLATDPAVSANRWDIDLYPTIFLQGGACLAKEPYEMVSYNFTRINFINDIANYKMNRGGHELWQQAISTQGVLMIGSFPSKDGGVIVYKGEENTDWFGIDQDEQVSLIQKKLWVARGSFCE